MAYSGNHAMVIVAVLVNGLGIGLMLPTLITWVMAQVDFAQRGRATGGFTAVLFAGEFLSPLVVLALSGGVAVALPDALVAVAVAQLVVALACLAIPRLFGPRAAVSAPSL